MHGMINRVIERFARDTYGREFWIGVTRRLALDYTEFEPMLTYEAELTQALLADIAAALDKPRDEVLEDIGTYLVSHPNVEALRRLLRFGGVTFLDFLHSLDDLPERARLAMSDLSLPALELRDYGPHSFGLTVGTGSGTGKGAGAEMPDGFGHVIVGLLRAMADDYGALVMLDHKGLRDGVEIIDIQLLETAFAEGRSFDLGARSA